AGLVLFEARIEFSALQNDVWVHSTPGGLGVGGAPVRRPISYLRLPVPNPSYGRTTLRYSIASPGRYHLGVYDLIGLPVRTLLDAECRVGSWTVEWDGLSRAGSKLRSGVYFIMLSGPGVSVTR